MIENLRKGECHYSFKLFKLPAQLEKKRIILTSSPVNNFFFSPIDSWKKHGKGEG